jgi:hypothetical protein
LTPIGMNRRIMSLFIYIRGYRPAAFSLSMITALGQDRRRLQISTLQNKASIRSFTASIPKRECSLKTHNLAQLLFEASTRWLLKDRELSPEKRVQALEI